MERIWGLRNLSLDARDVRRHLWRRGPVTHAHRPPGAGWSAAPAEGARMSPRRAIVSAYLHSVRRVARHSMAPFRAVPTLAAAALLAATAASLAASVATAAPACTRSWDGGAGTTDWNEAANWDGAGDGELPTATDHVCIDAGFTVEHGSAPTTSILSLRSDGDLVVSGGELLLTDTVNGSEVAALTQTGGSVGGPGHAHHPRLVRLVGRDPERLRHDRHRRGHDGHDRRAVRGRPPWRPDPPERGHDRLAQRPDHALALPGGDLDPEQRHGQRGLRRQPQLDLLRGTRRCAGRLPEQRHVHEERRRRDDPAGLPASHQRRRPRRRDGHGRARRRDGVRDRQLRHDGRHARQVQLGRLHVRGRGQHRGQRDPRLRDADPRRRPRHRHGPDLHPGVRHDHRPRHAHHPRLVRLVGRDPERLRHDRHRRGPRRPRSTRRSGSTSVAAGPSRTRARSTGSAARSRSGTPRR